MNRLVLLCARALPPLGLFALALAVRLLPWRTVLEGDRVVFFGMDAWYHMRRILVSLASSGPPLEFDAYVNFPHGAKPIWPPLFDEFCAWLLQPVYAAGDLQAVERAAALIPPVLGALCVVVSYQLAQRYFRAPIPFLAALLLSLLSAHFWYSQVGFVDHHVAIALVSTLLLWAAMRLVGALATTDLANGSGPWTATATTGILMAALLLLWPGAVLHVGIVELGLLGLVLTRPDRVSAARAARYSAVLYGLACLLVLPYGLAGDWSLWTAFSPVVISRFQPWMLGAMAVHSAICAALWSFTSIGRSVPSRVVQGLLVGVTLLGASLLAFPDLVAGAAEAWRWLTRDETFQQLVRESKPLLLGTEGFDLGTAEVRLSRFIYVFPLGLAALTWRGLRRPRDPALLLFVGWTAVLTVATLLQRRFFNSLSPAFTLVVVWSCVTAFRALPGAIRATSFRRAVTGSLAALVGLWLLAPTFYAYRISFQNAVRYVRGEPPAVPGREAARRTLLDVADWIRGHTPPTSGLVDAKLAPEYGLLAPWGFGHVLKYAAARPTVVGNFGDDVGEANMRRAAAYLASPEPSASLILESLRVRYVIHQTPPHAGNARLQGRAMAKRLSLDDSPGLERHRLVYESVLDSRRRASGRSEFRVFEHVPGALVTGRAPPGSDVRVSLGYESNRGRRGRYVSATTADSDGRYQLRVPYATRGAAGSIALDRAYRISASGEVHSLVVDEADVQSGAEVAGPEFSGRRDPRQ